jgi:ribonuclease HII
MSGPAPTDRRERRLLAARPGPVAGMDEVGRGAWAGPVSVGVAVHRPDRPPPKGLRDSKELAEHRRESLAPDVAAWCLDWAVGHAAPEECDRLGMTAALGLAARRALAGLRVRPGVLLLDGPYDYLSAGAPKDDPLPEVHPVVRGDTSCVSVAAASVLAKVTRDRLMRLEAERCPPFCFDRNKGYPSPEHRRALAGYGLTAIHRRSWSYVDDLAFR